MSTFSIYPLLYKSYIEQDVSSIFCWTFHTWMWRPGQNGSCLFSAGLSAGIVGSQNFQTFSTHQIQHLGDWWGELTTTTTSWLDYQWSAQSYSRQQCFRLIYFKTFTVKGRFSVKTFPALHPYFRYSSNTTSCRLMRRANNNNNVLASLSMICPVLLETTVVLAWLTLRHLLSRVGSQSKLSPRFILTFATYQN